MATEAARLNGNRLMERRKQKCALTSTGLLMEGLVAAWTNLRCALVLAPSVEEFARLLDQNNHSLALLTEVGTQCERAVIVQLLVTSPPHGVAHSLYLNFSSEFQSFPICDVRKHELRLPNLAR